MTKEDRRYWDLLNLLEDMIAMNRFGYENKDLEYLYGMISIYKDELLKGAKNNV